MSVTIYASVINMSLVILHLQYRFYPFLTLLLPLFLQPQTTFNFENNYCTFFILVINQLDAQNFCFTISLFHASTCFEHHVLVRRPKLYYTESGIVTPIDGRPVHRLKEDSFLSQPVHRTATYRCDDTRCYIIQF